MDCPEEDEGITFQDLLAYLATHGEGGGLTLERGEGGAPCTRWAPFENFRREVEGEVVMASEEGILRDFLPGTYSMAEIVTFPDLDAIRPAR